MSAPEVAAWIPDPETVGRSHLARAIGALGVDDYDGLHAWSCENIDAFWALVIDELGIAFEQAPSRIRGSDDPRHPDWLPDARLNIVASCLSGDGDALAIVAGDDAGTTRLTVAELSDRVRSFAAGLLDHGHRTGDHVAIVMPMTIEAVVAYLGIVAAGGVVVSVADSFAPDEIAVRLEITSAVRVVTQDRAIRLGRDLPMYDKCIAASDIPCIVVDTGARAQLRPGDLWWTEFLGEGEHFRMVIGSAATHTNILFSSGTTGDPKAIPWTQTTPMKAAMDGRFHQDIHPGDVVAWPTNLGWMMGPWLIYASLLNGAAMALYEDAPTTRGFIEFVGDADVTMLGVVPSIVAAWRAGGALTRGDWSSVRVISSTGEASNPDDSRWLMGAAGHVPVIEYCGGTEIGGGYVTGTVLHPAIPSRFTTAALGIELVILDDEHRPADRGEVFLRPPSIGLSTELLNRNHDEVYFEGVPTGFGTLRRHGDEMERCGDGTYRALGRVDDTMNLGGIKVSTADLEGAVAGVAGVIDVAAVAVPPPEGGPNHLVLFAVLADGDDADEGELRAAFQTAIRTNLNPLFRVDRVVVVDELPRTASHKVMRRLLRDEVTP